MNLPVKYYKYDIAVTGNISNKRPTYHEIDAEYLLLTGGILPEDIDHSNFFIYMEDFGKWIDSIRVKEIIYTLGIGDKLLLDYVYTKEWNEFLKKRNKPFIFVTQKTGIEIILNGIPHYIVGYNPFDSSSICRNIDLFAKINSKYGKNIIQLSYSAPTIVEIRNDTLRKYVSIPFVVTKNSILYHNMEIEKIQCCYNSKLFFYGGSVSIKKEISVRINKRTTSYFGSIYNDGKCYRGRCRHKLINAVYTDADDNIIDGCGVYQTNIR